MPATPHSAVPIYAKAPHRTETQVQMAAILIEWNLNDVHVEQ